ncbi:MAG: class I SAM-dependent methyltransferase [Bacteroidetes bacterium]|nr:MAG: class I SAM-dependent methyltransferase [Bacteroidota bacterium]
MPSWILKAALQKTLDLLPGGPALYRWGLARFSHRITSHFLADRLAHVERHLAAWQDAHPGQLPGRVLELGTGWCPVVPLGLWLCGVDQVDTYDIRLLVKTSTLEKLKAAILERAQEGQLKIHLPKLQSARLDQLLALSSGEQLSPQAWLARLGIRTFALPLSTRADLVISNNTFEHIPTRALRKLLPHLWAATRPGGVMSHYVDLVDHYSYFDARLSPFHFLRFSPSQWACIENRFQSQNRLRWPQYQVLFHEAGIPIDREECESEPAAALNALPLHEEFLTLPEPELLVSYVHIISQRPI